MLSRYLQSLVILLTIIVLLIVPLNQEIVSAATSKEVAYADKMEAYVKTQMETYKIPGMSIAIVKDGQVDYLQGFGIKNPNGEKVTPDTPFLLASVSKSFTAVAIMQLAEDGKLNVDDLVIKHLPWFDVAGDGENQITISHLLYHTSGLSELSGVEAILIPDEENALELGVRDLASVELAFNPGEQFEYSNLNYNILGLIVQEASGQTYEEYIEQHIFTPLEMNHSFTSMTEARENGATSGYYPFFGIPIVYDNYMVSSRSTLAAGGLWSSASDMSQYMIAHLNRPEQFFRILTSASISTLYEIGFEIDPSYGYGYAMGLFHADGFWDKELLEKQNTELNQYDFEQLNTYWHEGDWANYKS
ncbi:MAG: beta-lactamase family protein, partial [Anaerolineales bacterium]|nr:beta-lactamase family protein [Anaerolineales bacterium]